MISRLIANLGAVFTLVSCCGCDTTLASKDASTKVETTAIKVGKPALRIERWPPDHSIRIEDTTFQSDDKYRLRWITYSLNDNAVIDTVAMIAAHNEQTDLEVWKNDQPLFRRTLTKQLLGQARFEEPYAWNNIFYRGYRNRTFVFEASMCVPDSDICEEAEITIDEHGKVSFVKWLEQETSE